MFAKRASVFLVVLLAHAAFGADQAEPITLKGHEGVIRHLVYTPDGKKLVSATGRANMPFSHDGGEIKVWDTATGKELFSFLDPKTSIEAVAMCRDGKRFATISGNSVLRVWDIDQGKKHVTLVNRGAVESVAFSTDGKQIVYAGLMGDVVFIDAATGKQTFTFKTAGRITPRGLVFSPDDKLVAATTGGSEAYVWEATTGKLRNEIELKGRASRVLFAADGRLVIEGDAIRVWDLGAKKETANLTIKGTEGFRNCTLTANDKRIIAWSLTDRILRIFDLDTGKEIKHDLSFEKDGRGYAVFRPDLKQMAATFPKLTIQILPLAIPESGKTPSDP